MTTGAPGCSISSSPPLRIVGRELAGRNVLVLINSDEGGGVEHLAHILISDMERMGAAIRIVPLYRTGTRSAMRKVAGVLRAATDVLRTRPDLIMAFQPTSSAIAGIAGRLAGTRARIIHQSNMPGDTHPLPRYFDKAAGTMGLYSCIIANSSATKAAFCSYPARYRRALRRIDHGIEWRPARRIRADVLASLGVPDDGPLILSCARLVPQKGLHIVVEALSKLQRGRFIVLGQGPERERLASLAAKLGIADRLHLAGHVAHEHIHDIYAACDVFAFPSEWETFGIAALEAGMHGLPIVGNDIPALREVLTIEDRCVAELVAGGRPTDWAAALTAATADSGVRDRAMAHAPHLREKYGVERMLDSYRTLYRELVR